MTRNSVRTIVSGFASMAFMALGMLAQTAPTPKTYGTQDLILLQLPASAFHPRTSGVQFTYVEPGMLFDTGGDADGGTPFWAPVNLPNGAMITSIELHYHTNGFPIAATLVEYGSGNIPAKTDLVTISAPLCTTPPCDQNVSTVVNHAVNNFNSYVVHLQMDVNGTAGLYSVAIVYHLQVSPAPATATFGDVPTTSPQFRFVEALSAAGITAGCGSGNFCPDLPVTRGQMAVFLTSALGLNFPD